MYNRYIPQSDGSFQRSRMPEPNPRPPQPEHSQQDAPCTPAQGQPSPFSRPPRRPGPPPKQPPGHTASEGNGIFGFFRQLLPRDFGTEDLLIVLLLLLMAGDCKEDQNTALLTLALYLFL